eukprot:TRINITY_DN32885_c0_g1_i1.p1 TRINITY_DN32885_c0_g1~~TRINITY_DN32885_c0_g1_i1.p1  ORF type:complete len:433 (+),score=69.92 TRINITY_DN32885_c0_g1_i1:251-1549(+)
MDLHPRSRLHQWIFENPEKLHAIRDNSNRRAFASYLASTTCSPVGLMKAGQAINTPYSAFGKMNVKSPIPADQAESKISPLVNGVSPVLATTPMNAAAPAPGGTGVLDKLTVEEEMALQELFMGNIVKICSTNFDQNDKPVPPELVEKTRCAPVFGHLPPEVMATALVFFKRFFLNTSLMQQDPRGPLSAVCVYLALKVEDIRDFEEIGRFFKALRRLDPSMDFDEAEFHKLELRLLQGLGFHLAIHHPYRSIRGCIENWKAWSSRDRNSGLYRQVHAHARMLVEQLLFEDVFFLHSPGHVALACLRAACRRFNLGEDFEEWVSARCTTAQHAQELGNVLAHIDDLYLSKTRATMAERLASSTTASTKDLMKKYKGFQKVLKKGKASKKRAAEKPPSLSSGKKFRKAESPFVRDGNILNEAAPYAAAPAENP